MSRLSAHQISAAAERPFVQRLAEDVADVLLAGEWTHDAMLARLDTALRRPGGWIRQLARATVLEFPEPPVGRPQELARFLLANPPLPHICARLQYQGRQLPSLPLHRRTRSRRSEWPVPRWDSVADLADHLGLTAGELAWFADVQERHCRSTAEQLKHYRYRRIPRAGGRSRLVEAPKWQLREIQRRILHEVLGRMPAHDAAHGFRTGRSALTFATIHCGQNCVVRLDLESFFASIGVARIWGLFRIAGYADSVATVLAALVTTKTPPAERRVFQHSADPAERRSGSWLGVPHLPQGAPTSPALANLVAYRLDARLTGLAGRFGARYTRYADDLAFSGMPVAAASALRERVSAIVLDEGFRVNAAKSLVRPAASRQAMTGLVVNAHPNIARPEFDRLKAVLHNCAVHGPASQNRAGHADWRAHLLGRVSWIEQVNPAKGARLRREFDRIDWR
ncbi:MAG TPA: reverse transcriptase family protein [Mycobacteriales bacterium]|nr:reverse transcriptase family protein [Mycobacteriales bacterium]